MKNKKILFVCKHNRFRSKIAEAYFNKINRNKNIKAYSAGIFKGIPVNRKVISIGKKLGITINKKTNGLQEALIYKIDIVVIVADNVPASIFKNKVKKVLVWKISDSQNTEGKSVEEIVSKIIKKVEEFVESLK